MLLKYGVLFKQIGDKVMYLKQDRNGYYYRIQKDKSDAKRTAMFLIGITAVGIVFGFMYLMFSNFLPCNISIFCYLMNGSIMCKYLHISIY